MCRCCSGSYVVVVPIPYLFPGRASTEFTLKSLVDLHEYLLVVGWFLTSHFLWLNYAGLVSYPQ
jgi:hypothetical protein